MEFTDNSEPPKLYHKWVAISTVASVLQRKCVVNWGPIRFYPNMYIVLVAPPGKARKGTAMSSGIDFLVRAEIKMSAESVTREALIRRIHGACETITYDDDTKVEFHSSLTIIAPELSVFLGYNQHQLMMDLTDWFDCGKGPEGKWTYETKNMGRDEITGLWVNLIGATTPDLLRSNLSIDAIGGGLTSRIIFVYAADKYKSCPAPFLTPEQIKIGEMLYDDLEQIHLLRGQFKPDKEFINRWVEWYIEQDNKEIFAEPHLFPYCERRPVHIMKLSMIFNSMRTDSMVMTVDDINQAIDLLEYTEQFMPKVFAGIGKSPHAEVLTSVMNTIGMAGELTRKELMKRHYQDADERVMELIIETLCSTGFISRILKGDGTEVLRYIPSNPKVERSE